MIHTLIPEDDVPLPKSNWLSKFWVVRKILNPTAYQLNRPYKALRLHILLPLLALLAVAYLVGFYAMQNWWIKEKIVTRAPWNYVHTAQAKELTIEEYICTKKWDCKTALAVAKAESGLRCDAQNVNKGTNSLDAGLFQINSVHLKKAGWKIADLLDCKKNTDMAYEIYKGSGWVAWSAYTNKSYKRFIN